MREMLEGKKLINALESRPDYTKEICLQPTTARLMRLEECMSEIYISNKMTVEIYNKMYLASYKAETKKKSITAVKQHYENYKLIHSIQPAYQGGIIGGSDSFTIIGESGIGKTTAIRKAMKLIGNPKDEIVSCIQVQCPNDCSIKGLLLNLLQEIDCTIGTDYFVRAMKSRPTTDMLIGIVSIACQNHLNLLVVDEIQNVRLNMKSKSSKNNGETLIAMLVQLINSSGISVVLVGTPEIEPVFQMQEHLARRTVGLRYNAIPYGKEFKEFCSAIYGYQFTRKADPFSEAISLWLYQHTAGRVSLIVSLIKDAQEISILDGSDCLGMASLEKAYKERYQYISRFVKLDTVKTAVRKKAVVPEYELSAVKSSVTFSVQEVVTLCRKKELDVVEELKPHIAVVEVKV